MKKYFLVAVCFAIATSSAAHAQQPFQATKEHGVLKKDVGVWNAKGKMWMPGVPEAMEFEGVETNEMIGELWLVTDFRGNFAGMEFRGHGRAGYNPESKKYEGTWFDSTNPWAMSMSGTYDESTQTKTSIAKFKDSTGAAKENKTTIVYKDDDNRVMTTYGPDPDGGDKLVKEMEIVYSRKK